MQESIRRGHDDLGDHFLECGDLNNALKCYSRARDYCTSGRHVVQMCLNVIKVSVYLQNWSHVISYVNKAMSTPEFSERKQESMHRKLWNEITNSMLPAANIKGADYLGIYTRLHCAYGLAELANNKFKSAAKHFLNASLDHCDLPDLMSTQV